MNDITLIIQEVVNALIYSVNGNAVSSYWLDYYRRNLAEDSRYTFKIHANLLDELGIIYVKYRKKLFKCKRYWEEVDGENLHFFTVEITNEGCS